MKVKFKLFRGDCLELMKQIPDGSVDLVLCDLPYGTTACTWDVIIPLEPLWEQYRRVAKRNAAIVLTASQPFTSVLVTSNLRMFRHSWVWNKKSAANVMAAKYGPLKVHEDVLVFSKQKAKYLPIMTAGKMRWKGGNNRDDGIYAGEVPNGRYLSDLYHPKSILEFSNASQKGKSHPTQKPEALMEYLIKTYTNPGDTVLDNCMGSGTTGVAAVRHGRFFIGMELDDVYFQIAQDRIQREFDGEGQ